MGRQCLSGTKSSDVTDTPDVILWPKSISFAFWWLVVWAAIALIYGLIPCLCASRPWTRYFGSILISVMMLYCCWMIPKRNMIGVVLALLATFFLVIIQFSLVAAIGSLFVPFVLLALPKSIRWLRGKSVFSLRIITVAALLICISEGLSIHNLLVHRDQVSQGSEPVVGSGMPAVGLDADREVLDKTLELLFTESRAIKPLTLFFSWHGYCLAAEYEEYRNLRDEAFSGLSDLQKEMEVLIHSANAMRERWLDVTDCREKDTVKELEPRRVAMLKLAQLINKNAHTALLAMTYNIKASVLNRDKLEEVRKQYLDEGVDANALPVNPKSRAEQKVFFDLARERFERAKSAIYDELSKEVLISWGFQYELMRHAERPLSQRR